MQWDDCSCGDCALCGGTAPLEYSEAELRERKPPTPEPEPEPRARTMADDDAALLASLRSDVNETIEVRVAAALEVERKVRVCARIFWTSAYC